jgi:hypothetical protein
MSFPEDEQPKPIEPVSQPDSSNEEPNPVEPAPSEETSSGEVEFPEDPALPEDFTPFGEASRLPRARRRRAHRTMGLPGADERAAILDGLARRAFPSIEFFVFALLGGTVIGAAYLMDSPAMLLLGILLAPLLTPWVGLILAIQTGSWRFFFQTLGGFLVASLLVFLTGTLAGWVGHLWQPLPLSQASLHSHLWWPDLFLVALGAILLTISFVRSERRPILPSIMLAYGLFMPLSAGGVGLGLGIQPIWPDGAEVFLVHLALAMLVGVITLASLRFKPLKASGYLLPIIMGLFSLAALAYFTGLTTIVRNEIFATRQIVPTATLAPIPTNTPTVMPTATVIITTTPLPSNTPQPTATTLPTPVYAVIQAATGGGAYIRSQPGSGNGTALAVLINGTLVQVLPEIQSINGISWVDVRWNNVDGWVLSSVLLATTKTPLPPTPTFTPTP